MIGPTATAALIEAFGGRQFFIPASASDGSGIAKVIGLDAAKKLSHHFRQARFADNSHGTSDRLTYTGRRVFLPYGRERVRDERRATAMEMIAKGSSVAEIVAATGLTDRTVFRYRRRLRLRAQQLKKRRN